MALAGAQSFLMLLEGVPLKVKLVGMGVLVVLLFSLLGATLGVINQIVSEDAARSQLMSDNFASQSGSKNPGAGDDTVIVTLKFICPFH